MSDIHVVAVHGNGGGSTRFDRLGDRLGDRVRLTAIDLPGFNGVPLDPIVDSVPTYADRLADLLPDDRPVVVLGHGIGGSIALDLVSRRPETVDGLVLHAPVGAHLDSRLFPKLMSPPVVRRFVRRAISARPLRGVLHNRFFPTGVPEPHRARFFEGYRSCEAFGLMFDIIDAPWFDGLTPIGDVPTRLLWGSGDRVLDAEHTASFQEKAPSAAVEIIDGWDHFPMLEQPDEYGEVIARIAEELIDG
ncbi:MAG: alpha/beta hydrolase [Actinomycetota bacterium]